MDREKSIILKTFKYLIDFLDSHNIGYFMAAGSALGTVRHHGFIPWDDDIDIIMFRSEYEKLINCSDEMQLKGYKLINLSNTDNYYLRFAKVVDINTTLWEVKKYPCLIGSFVDIFLLDNSDKGVISCNEKHLRYKKLMTSYLAYVEHHSFWDYIDAIRHGQIIEIVRWFLTMCTCYRKEQMKNNLLQHETTLSDGDGPLLVNYTEEGMYIYPKEWFSEYILMPFEGLQVKMPKGYHDYLRYMYGDYMKLPPEEERKSYHFHYYYNTEEGLTIKEVRKRIKLGENLKMARNKLV